MGTTVLIVDDHPTFRRFARRLLEHAGFAVVGEAVDGADAIRATKRLRPEAVLLDVLLPDRSGLDVAAELADRWETTVVVLTSSRSAEDLGSVLDGSRARGFIPKNALTGAAFSALIESS